MKILFIFIIYFCASNAYCESDVSVDRFSIAGKDFSFPSKFTARNKLSKDLLNRNAMAELCVHYNSWRPCGAGEDINGVGGQDIFNIWIRAAKKGRTDSLLESVQKKFNEKKDRYPYYWEKINGGIALYEPGKGYVVKSYIFMADDGENVMFRGIYDKTPIYRVYRKLFDGIELSYVYNRDVGSDFKKIDKKLSGWVKSFLVKN